MSWTFPKNISFFPADQLGVWQLTFVGMTDAESGGGQRFADNVVRWIDDDPFLDSLNLDIRVVPEPSAYIMALAVLPVLVKGLMMAMNVSYAVALVGACRKRVLHTANTMFAKSCSRKLRRGVDAAISEGVK